MTTYGGPPQLGRRGGGWVALQMLLLALLAIVGLVDLSGWPEAYRSGLRTLGVLAMSAGTILAVFAITGLGSALTAVPAPLAHASLRTDGVYAHVRHPIYAGLLLLALGWSLLTTPWCLLLTAVLAVVLDLKRRVEERFLEATYPEYALYRHAVPNALVPYVW
jgi:protein-S-isoprenylcysteine O-methyltransferase Ste14